ncbi:hypothetical protein QBC43DRAFT_331865 [Cladorrhinum sp. PSN259]|nr:hypothetical protein QBC43DRAFT_331865 [Cladorrhinum sp. PSN259]
MDHYIPSERVRHRCQNPGMTRKQLTRSPALKPVQGPQGHYYHIESATLKVLLLYILLILTADTLCQCRPCRARKRAARTLDMDESDSDRDFSMPLVSKFFEQADELESNIGAAYSPAYQGVKKGDISSGGGGGGDIGGRGTT